ncbi:MAG TPA: cytidine deaminase [Candidatus Avamphibacillus intestinigallinarum]|nr:cytidine deaminase [Candidatus Avamphibacillus intestinigallinarum]
MKIKMIEEAKQAYDKAYAPYSKFKVGAAVKTKDGSIYHGCNIENASYSATCCAERVAIFQAIANGENQFTEIAVVANSEKPVPPCGICRQVMQEFFSNDVKIYLSNLSGNIEETTIDKLLPYSFSEKDLFKG